MRVIYTLTNELLPTWENRGGQQPPQTDSLSRQHINCQIERTNRETNHSSDGATPNPNCHINPTSDLVRDEIVAESPSPTELASLQQSKANVRGAINRSRDDQREADDENETLNMNAGNHP